MLWLPKGGGAIQDYSKFFDIRARDTMTSRIDMVAINIADNQGSICKQVLNSPHSKLPVYDGTIDNIVGIIHLNRFLKAAATHEGMMLQDLLLPPLFVYQTTKLPQVLAYLRINKEHMAIVTDEYGGAQGIITLEDVLEQIVGEVQDETDTMENDIVVLPNGELSVSGATRTSHLLELISIFEDDFYFESKQLKVGRLR